MKVRLLVWPAKSSTPTNDIFSNPKSNDFDKNFNEEDKFIRNVTLNKSTSLGVNKIDFKDRKSLGLKLDLNEMQNWRFASEKIEVDAYKWTAKKLYLTNDPFNSPQLILKSRGFRSITKKDKTYIRSIRSVWYIRYIIYDT